MSTKKTSIQNARRYEYIATLYCSELQLKEYLRIRSDMRVIEHWCYILHDMDAFTVDDERVKSGEVNVGDLKKPHYHLLLRFVNAKTKSAFIRDFDNCQWKQDDGNPATIYYCDVLTSRYGSFNYLTHNGFEGKYQYPIEKIVSSDNGIQFFNVISDIVCESDDTIHIYEKLSNGIPVRELIKLYGRDFLYHIGSYKLALEMEQKVDKLVELQSECNNLSDELNYYRNKYNKIRAEYELLLKLKDTLYKMHPCAYQDVFKVIYEDVNFE